MVVNRCERCGTSHGKTRLAGYCPWCYAVVKNRPEDAVEEYGPVTDWRAENPQRRKCTADGCTGVMVWDPHHHGRQMGAYVCQDPDCGEWVNRE